MQIKVHIFSVTEKNEKSKNGAKNTEQECSGAVFVGSLHIGLMSNLDAIILKQYSVFLDLQEIYRAPHGVNCTLCWRRRRSEVIMVIVCLILSRDKDL